MNTTQPETRRGRPPREERRRKSRDAGEVVGKRLAVLKSQLDFDNYKYRWINDEMGRIMAMTKEDDWDIVANDGGAVREDSADLGDAVSEVVGLKPDGSPMRAYLARKPKKFWNEDRRARYAALDDQLAELRRGNARDGSPNGDYVPLEGIRL